MNNFSIINLYENYTKEKLDAKTHTQTNRRASFSTPQDFQQLLLLRFPHLSLSFEEFQEPHLPHLALR